MELQRGDLPTRMSGVALAMKSLSEPGLALRILKVLGKEKFARGYIYDAASKTSVHSHLLRISLPAGGETFDTFRQQVAELAIADSRLVDLAVYAPHWAPFVEYATGISGLETVAFWLHAHTKDQYWEVDEQIREQVYRKLNNAGGLSQYFWQAAPSIHIIVRNSNVTLKGYVDSVGDKDLAGITVKEIANVFNVKNELQVIK